MERAISDRNILDRFAEKFCKIIDSYVKYIVVSGFVAIAHGRSRATEDIDVIIERVPFEKFKEIHEELSKNGFVCMQSSESREAYDYLDRGLSIRYTESEDLLPPEMEVKFEKDEIDRMQLATRRRFEFTGLDIWFSSIEMNIAFKEEYLRTPKDVEDARHLRIIYKGEISEESINSIKKMIREKRMKDER